METSKNADWKTIPIHRRHHTRETSPDEGHGDGDEEGVELVERLLGLVDLGDQLAVVVLVLQGRVELGQSAIRKKKS